MADFFTETEKLAKRVGDGAISAILAVDGGERSVPLEVGAWRNFMGKYGPKTIENYNQGSPHAAQKAFQESAEPTLKDVAETLLVEGPEAGMERGVGRMRDAFKENAPKRTGQYSESSAGFVIDNGQPVHQEYGPSYGEDPS